MNVVAGVMLVLGFGFILSGVIGILRLPDFYCRLHAMGTCDTLGVALMIGGLAVSEGFTHTLRGEGDDFVTHVINFIAREGIRVRGFRTEIPTLEDVFLKLTGHGIRD